VFFDSPLLDITAAVLIGYLVACVTIPLVHERRRNNDR